jgi:hypothetical protein
MLRYIIFTTAFWFLVIGAPIFFCRLSYRLINRAGYPKLALIVSLLILIGFITLYNFININ